MGYLEQVFNNCGVKAITIADLLKYIREIKRRFPLVEICASVLVDIDCIGKMDRGIKMKQG